MSDFARMMELARAGDPAGTQEALGTPAPSEQEMMAANEKAIADAQAAAAKPAATTTTAARTTTTTATTTKPAA